MARNYSMKEAVAIIAEGKDFESIMDIGRRYPLLLNMVSKVAAKAGDDFVELMNHLPDHVTANKVNTSMKNLIEEGEDEEGEPDAAEEKEEKPAKKEKKEKKEEAAGDDYESMTGKELYELLGKAGKRKDCKEKMGGLKKDDILAYIKKYGLEDDEVEEDVEEENDGNPYEGKSAMDLFKECKKRGIKAAPKKPAKFYADLLIKDDEKAAEPEDDGDDWEEEEAVEEKPAKKEKKEKKSKKEEVEEDDDADEDDDWDI